MAKTRTRTLPETLASAVVLTGAVALGHLHAWGTRLNHLVLRVFEPPRPKSPRGDTCPLCTHQLGAPEQRPPRDTRTNRGQLKRLPAEVLAWRRCGGCGLYQTGRKP